MNVEVHMKFDELGLAPELLEAISKLGFEEPTPVQAKVIPVLLESDSDVVALAQTGTGKTAAFGLPALQRLDIKRAVPQTLILCPTRELCMQIARDLQSYASSLSARILAVYGGADIQPQLTALRRGVHIVVATPGRMLDVLRRKKVDFSKVTSVVLDEADEMLNMGFEEDLEGILSTVPEGAQTLLFSATMPSEVAKISRKYMKSPVEFTMGARNAGAENVSHEYYVVHAKDRYRSLRRIVDVYPRMYGIVFCRTRVETQQIADHLGVDGYNSAPLHGDLSQLQRDSVMKKFRDRHVQILVATDVAARGLDVNDLSHVINYNMPDELNAYTHRSGRTGRAGKEGISASIINPRDQAKIKRLERVIGKSFTKRNVPTGNEISRVRVLELAERVRDYETENGLIDRHIEEVCAILEELPKEEVIKRFVSINLHRMLHFYRAAPDLNVSASKASKPRRAQRSERSERPHGRDRASARSAKNMAGLVMNVGSANGLTPPGLLNLVNVANRDSRFDIGRINIVNKQAYFEVPRQELERVIGSFEEGDVSLDGRKVTVASVGTGFKEPPRKKGRGQGKTKKRR
jgi:ATP-dependent RNA helicase DeaD